MQHVHSNTYPHENPAADIDRFHHSDNNGYKNGRRDINNYAHFYDHAHAVGYPHAGFYLLLALYVSKPMQGQDDIKVYFERTGRYGSKHI